MKEERIKVNENDILLKIYTKNNNKNIIISPKCGYISISKPRYISEKKAISVFIKNFDNIYENYKKVNIGYNMLKNNGYILHRGVLKKLVIIKAKNIADENVKITDDKIIVTLVDIKDMLNIKKLITLEYKKRILDTISKKLKIYIEKFLEDGYYININKVSIKLLRSKWGSFATLKNNLCFNIKMEMLKEDVINYIVVHELSHAIEPNHSTRFWSIVKKYCKNYKVCNKYLKENYSNFLYLDD